MADALHEVPVAAEDEDVMVDRARSEVRTKEALGHPHADAVGEALAEGAGRDLDAGRDVNLGMARRARSPLAELLDVVEREAVAVQVQHRVQKHRRVPVRQDEAVAIGPVGMARVVAQHPREQDVRERRERHRSPGMAAVGLLDGVHREASNHVYAKLFQLGVGHGRSLCEATDQRHCDVRTDGFDTKRASASLTEATPPRTMSRITHQPGSSSWRPSASFAEVGAAWWLLWRPSPAVR